MRTFEFTYVLFFRGGLLVGHTSSHFRQIAGEFWIISDFDELLLKHFLKRFPICVPFARKQILSKILRVAVSVVTATKSHKRCCLALCLEREKVVCMFFSFTLYLSDPNTGMYCRRRTTTFNSQQTYFDFLSTSH